MFNNCDSQTNGETAFFNNIRNSIHTIFDIGSRNDSLFTDFAGEVHYFDPVSSFIDDLSKQHTKNTKSFYNKFGLSDTEESINYFPAYQSFYDRIESCKQSDEKNKITLHVKRADAYMENNNIESVDFIKIDTEGYELHVIKGFGDKLRHVKIIQFEYGGTFLDNKINLIEVIEYLKNKGFDKFRYLHPNGQVEIADFKDHYQYCNIVCFNTSL